MREQFENHFKETDAYIVIAGLRADPMSFNKHCNEYKYTVVQAGWGSWQARQAEVDHLAEMNQRYIGKMQEQQDQIAELKATTKESFGVGEF